MWEHLVRKDITQKTEYGSKLRMSCGKTEKLGCQMTHIKWKCLSWKMKTWSPYEIFV